MATAVQEKVTVVKVDDSSWNSAARQGEIGALVLKALGKPPRFSNVQACPLFTRDGLSRYRVNIRAFRPEECLVKAQMITDSFYVAIPDGSAELTYSGPEIMPRYL